MTAVCMCDFPTECDGGGLLECTGCGGEFCVCGPCNGHGEMECDGCSACAEPGWGDYEDAGGEA